MIEIYIIEPHHDDAVYSLGGMLQTEIFQRRSKLITVFSDSEICNPKFRSKISKKLIRKKETQLAANQLKMKWIPLEIEDGNLSEAGIDEKGLYQEISTKINKIVKNEDIVFLPVGFGANPHHRIVGQLRKNFAHHILYEDTTPVPAYSRILDSFIHLYNELYSDYLPYYLDITDYIDRKVELASIYKSQFSKKSCHSLKSHARNIALFAHHTDYCDNSLQYAERIYIPRIKKESLFNILFSPCGKGYSPAFVNMDVPKSIIQYKRKTKRNLFGIEISFSDVCRLLYSAVAITGKFKHLGLEYNRYAYPTAGGLSNSEIYLLAYNVSKIESGIYKYDPFRFALIPYSKIPSLLEFTKMIENQEWGLGASFAVIIQSRGIELHQKYRSRAIQLSLLEAGHVCQNLLLAADSIGLNAVEIGGFSKQLIRSNFNIIEPLVLLLFSRSNSDIIESELEKFKINDLFKHTAEIDSDNLKFKTLTDMANTGVATRLSTMSCGTDEQSNAKLITRTHIYHIADIGVWISRTDIPLKPQTATGTSLFFSEKQKKKAFYLSVTKSEAEANEIFSSFAAVPESLVYTKIENLRSKGKVVTADKIGLDYLQKRKADLDLFKQNHHSDDLYHYVACIDLINGEQIWCPADSVLISKRFWDQAFWPSSTGYGCGVELTFALSHSLKEIVEKILIPFYVAPQPLNNIRYLNDNIQNIIRNINHELLDLTIYSAVLFPYKYILLISKEKSIWGSSVHTSLDNAIKGAAEEFLAKFFHGSNEEFPVLLGCRKDAISMLELLRINKLSIAYTYFHSALQSSLYITKAVVYETE